MRVDWVLLRLIGLAVLAALAALAGSRLAGADEPAQKTPPKIDARPNATGQGRMAPAGTIFGTETPLRNEVPAAVQNPPHSPTPPGFPFGPPGGSYAPAGPSASPPQPATGFTNHW